MEINKIDSSNINIVDYIQYMNILKELEIYYPNIISWFFNKVIPSINFGTRKILELENIEGEKIGFSIIKDTIEKQKISTLYILERYQNKGYFMKLFNESFKELGNNKPLYTVNENFIDIYKKIAKKFDHDITGILEGKYIPGKKEYIFNGFDDFTTSILIY